MAKKIVVLGAAESGIGAAVLAQKEGFDIFVSDFGKIKPEYKEMLEKYHIAWEEGAHTESIVLAADEIIKSPGIPEKAPIIKKLRGLGTPIISEIEFAKRYTNAKMICITGSNGKTTTTSLIYHILENAGLNVGLAGNIGKSLAWQVAECNYDYYVVELSSFQLDGMYNFKADVAILLNITPDHLDRYDYKFQNYIDSKFRIIQNQTAEDAFIYWNDDPVITAELEKRDIASNCVPFALEKKADEKAYIQNSNIVFNINDPFSIPQGELAIQGVHNLYNSMAAGLAADIINVKNEVIRQSFSNFQGVEHRLEYVATVRGIRFINDSKATNVNSCWYALQSMTTPVILILGGTDKGNDYTEIEELVRQKAHTLIFMGLDNHKLHDFFDKMAKKTFDVQSIETAVKTAYENGAKGDTVLLSPCCASFDLFQNYEDRGTQFKEHVRKL
ncbi:MAG: UDP-N-acetylmuramoylalanine--D-glutamate ligase [Bacteroidetes bacterium]|nr:UDP-N-acetylmuramoylalanine--D-glutamate ligase [Bacteroidota bacterium]